MRHWTGCNSSTRGTRPGPMWRLTLRTSSGTSSWEWSLSSCWSSNHFKPSILGITPVGIHLQLTPLVLNTSGVSRSGSTLIIHSLVGCLISGRKMIPPLVGRISTGRWMICNLAFTPPLRELTPGGRVRMEGTCGSLRAGKIRSLPENPNTPFYRGESLAKFGPYLPQHPPEE